jgi:hypothetical protein
MKLVSKVLEKAAKKMSTTIYFTIVSLHTTRIAEFWLGQEWGRAGRSIQCSSANRQSHNTLQ